MLRDCWTLEPATAISSTWLVKNSVCRPTGSRSPMRRRRSRARCSGGSPARRACGDRHSIRRDQLVQCSRARAEPIALLVQMRDRLVAGGYLLLTTPNPHVFTGAFLGCRNGTWCARRITSTCSRAEGCSRHWRTSASRFLEYSTLSTYIRAVRKFDTDDLLLRKAAFQLLKRQSRRRSLRGVSSPVTLIGRSD